ncbi:hypothetical protein [Hymenobacter armeniacus]|uniref:DUF4468 domain-containing protein n=1 Tax=Hymenobacter armeniacus TaxID=2771358 RepID=A0ABR8JVI5_9BACT|nr:hypothetical protein [Hymenobacter armeniacus]MBD2723979.1 hypothetical protein [Hymenobacter armeniacus]
MKTLLPIALFCCLTGTTMGQAPASFPLDKATRRICYTAVVPAAGVSQADLRARARAWASGIAPASRPPIETSELDTEVVAADGSQPFAYTYEAVESGTRPARHYTIKLVLHYTTKLSLREGRYRYEITTFVIEYPMAKPPSPTSLPAEADLIEARALNENGSNSIAAERKSFAEAAAKLQAQLKQRMNTPITPAEAKQ